jgi:xylulokinase
VSLLGVDIGSSRCKAAAFTTEGRALAEAAAPYAPESPGPAMAEMDPGEFRRAVVRTVREAAAVAAGASDPVQALCISSHGETFIPVDRAGAAVGRAIMNSDNRAVDEADWWERTIGRERLYRTTGLPPHPMYALPKIRWLQRHRADLFRAAARFMGPSDWVLTSLGLPPLTDFSLVSRWMAFDIGAHRWSEEILAAADIRAGVLPEVVAAGTLAGRLGTDAARELGLEPGTAVAVGGHDQPCGALGSGAIDPGVVADSAGTYECLTVASREPCLGPASMRASLNSYCHVVPDRYVTLAFFPSGIVVRWFLERLAAAEAGLASAAGTDPHAWFEARTSEGPSGVCVTPHLIGACNPHWNARASAAVIGLTPASDIFAVYQGILEGIACEFGLNADTLADVTGAFSRVRIYGGGAGSRFGLRLRAALSGRTVETLRNPEAVCLGAAILAGVAAGVYRDPQDGVRRVVGVAAEFPPDSRLAAAYSDQVGRYRRLYPALAPLFSGE